MKKIMLLLLAALTLAATLATTPSCTGDESLDESLAELWSLVARAELLSEADYGTESWATFREALEHAKSVVIRNSPSLDTVKTAVQKLIQAMRGLVNMQTAKENLAQAIAVADTWANEGYAAETWDAFLKVLADVKTAYADPAATIDGLTAALNRLLAAFDSLVKA